MPRRGLFRLRGRGQGGLNGNGAVKVVSRRAPVVEDFEERLAYANIAHILHLRWPQDARLIARLPLPEFQMWLSAIDPRELIFMAQSREFKQFVWRHYLLPVKIKRFILKVRKSLPWNR